MNALVFFVATLAEVQVAVLCMWPEFHPITLSRYYSLSNV